MGQYHYPINITKKQFLNPHKLGDGLKLREQNGGNGGVCSALHMLLAGSNGRGGGDFDKHPLIGSWCGDRIAILGDYAEPGDIPGRINAQRVMKDAMGEDKLHVWKDISEEMIPLLEQNCEVRFDTDENGWRSRVKAMDDEEWSHSQMLLKLLQDLVKVAAKNPVDIDHIRNRLHWFVGVLKREIKGYRKPLEGPVITDRSMV